jgi:hypothetical protein
LHALWQVVTTVETYPYQYSFSLSMLRTVVRI